MLYSVYAVLGVYCSQCMLYSVLTLNHGIERYDLTSGSQVMAELMTRKREMRGDGANHPEKLGLTEFHVQVNLPSPIWQVQVPIWWEITLIQGLPNPIRQVVPLISHIH